MGVVSFLLAVPGVGASDLLIGGFAVDLPGGVGDEAVELINVGRLPIDLSKVTLGDLEGRLGFAAELTLDSGNRLVLATNATAYRQAARASPDVSLDDPPGHLVAVEPGFRLADDGDELLLYRDGALVDAVAYASSTYAGPGWTGPAVELGGDPFLRWFRRGEGGGRAPDSDSSRDWSSPKREFLGWSHLRPERVEGVHLTAFTAPDRSRQVFLDLLERTQSRLWINVYEFLEPDLARRIASHASGRPGFDLRVLIDESPVGMTSQERLVRNGILKLLSDHGAVVRLMQHDRYGFDHAKYALGDDRWVLVQSENLVASGVPTDPTRGNRGWGVLLESPQFARAAEALFLRDFEEDSFGARDPGEAERETVALPVVPTAVENSARLGTVEDPNATATLVLAPDHTLSATDPVLAAITKAESEILVEQLNLPPVWVDRTGRRWPNEYLDALTAAAERGVTVRVLLDGHFVDASSPSLDNWDTRETLSSASAPASLQVRLMKGDDTPLLHVKGLVVDRKGALVGSMNWNLHSVAQNREVDVWVESPRAAGLFATAFESDWTLANALAVAESTPAAGLMGFTIVITSAGLWTAMRPIRRSPE